MEVKSLGELIKELSSHQGVAGRESGHKIDQTFLIPQLENFTRPSTFQECMYNDGIVELQPSDNWFSFA